MPLAPTSAPGLKTGHSARSSKKGQIMHTEDTTLEDRLTIAARRAACSARRLRATTLKSSHGLLIRRRGARALWRVFAFSMKGKESCQTRPQRVARQESLLRSDA